MDETREILYQRQIQKERGESYDNGASPEEMIVAKARAIRLFHEALVSQGFSEQDSLLIIINVPV